MNWPQLADLTQAIFEEKQMWDIVDKTRLKPTTTPHIKKKDKDNAIDLEIIK